MLFPKLTFDHLSLYLILVAAGCVLFPDITDFLARLRRAKFAGAEIELAVEQLAEQAHEVTKIGNPDNEPAVAVSAEADEQPGPEAAAPEALSVPEGVSLHYWDQSEPLSRFLEHIRRLSRDIMAFTREVYGESLVIRTPSVAMHKLANDRLVDRETYRTYRGLMNLRSTIVHGDAGFTRLQLATLIDVADKIRSAIPVGRRINVDERYEVATWAAKLGVSEKQIREAVERVGPSVGKVMWTLRADAPPRRDEGFPSPDGPG